MAISTLPEKFISSLKGLDHFDAGSFLAVHESAEQLVSIHMNPGKPFLTDGKWPEHISEPAFHISKAVPWAADAYYLSARPFFTLDPLFHAGVYYVQEASGMFLAFALKQSADLTKNLKVLDLCAAPGGKSTLLQSLLSPDSLLVSNEVIKTRVPVLYQNMTKWGRINGMITNNDPTHFKQLPGFFDVLVIDAPCSGSGLFRKDPDAALNWSEDLVRLCSQRQQRILADAWDALKEDGLLIYSTCSYSKEENEDILDYMFKNFSCVSIPLSPEINWQITETRSDETGAYGYRFYPDKLAGEGFFLSVLQKKEPARTPPKNKSKRNPLRIPRTVENQVGAWIENGVYQYIEVGDSIHILNPAQLDDFELLKNSMYLKKAGVRIGKAGEKDWIPDHELALADILKKDSAALELSKPDMLHFLRGEPFPADLLEKGWRIVSYMGQSVGWVKLLGNRINNYYPKSWRIRQ